jgi:hypothetical protein
MNLIRGRKANLPLLILLLQIASPALYAQPGGRDDCSTIQLQRAEGAYKVGDFVLAKSLAKRLLPCPEAISSRAQQLLETIETRERSNVLASEAYLAIRRKRFQDACKLLRQIETSDPTHPNLKSYVQMAGGCSDFEKELEQARTWVNQRKWDRALQILRIVENSEPDYPGLQDLLQAVQKGQEEENQNQIQSSYDRAKRLIAERKLKEAREILLRLQSTNPDYRDVSQLLADLQTKGGQQEQPQRDQGSPQLVSKLQLLVAQGEYHEAKKLIASGPNLRGGQLESLSNQIDSGLLQEQNALISALDLFYEGDLERAEVSLTSYLDAKHSARLRAIARFYLSLTHASRFLLMGGTDEEQRTAALQTYEALFSEFPGFQPRWEFVSGRVREFYQDAAGP